MYSDEEQEDSRPYKVVLNHEEQYSIWLVERENPPGWRDSGMIGSKAECLKYIDDVWTDMRPLSLRLKMEEDARLMGLAFGRLLQAEHQVVIPWPRAVSDDIQSSMKCGFLPIAFIEVPDLPPIGLTLNQEATDVSQADFSTDTGVIHVEGTGAVYAVGQVHCVATIDLATKTGKGRIQLKGTAGPA